MYSYFQLSHTDDSAQTTAFVPPTPYQPERGSVEGGGNCFRFFSSSLSRALTFFFPSSSLICKLIHPCFYLGSPLSPFQVRVVVMASRYGLLQAVLRIAS